MTEARKILSEMSAEDKARVENIASLTGNTPEELVSKTLQITENFRNVVRRLCNMFQKFAEAFMQSPETKKKIKAREKHQKRVANRQKLYNERRRKGWAK